MALAKCGALWLKEGAKGKFLSGEIDLSEIGEDVKTLDVLVFKNDKGDNPKRPDYTINRRIDEPDEITNPDTDDDIAF